MNATIGALSGPQFLGLTAAFGCGSADTPDVVVCDFASPGCHDFARLVGASLVLNVPDAYSAINFVSVDHATPAFFNAINWPVITRDVLLEAKAGQSALSLSGVLSRASSGLFSLLFYSVVTAYARRWEQDWRPKDLPMYVAKACVSLKGLWGGEGEALPLFWGG